jgi:hypothetical protein
MLKHDTIPQDIKETAFELLYWFSRFEFALKECHFLRSTTPGAEAQVSWSKFVEAHQGDYELSDAGQALIAASPQVQIVGEGGDLDFRPFEFAEGATALAKVSSLAKVVRNNLFHGGKHSVEGWDDPERVRKLLPIVVVCLDEMSKLGDLSAPYRREY